VLEAREEWRHFVVTLDYDREKRHIAPPPEEPERPTRARESPVLEAAAGGETR